MTKQDLLKTAKPILFNTDMVRAILDGRKTKTRRVLKVRYKDDEYGFRICRNIETGEQVIETTDSNEGGTGRFIHSPYNIGDILYVRETWYYESHMHDLDASSDLLPSGNYLHRYIFKADSPDYPVDVGVGEHGWYPSIHMPKEAARIFLRVTDVRVERLQDIIENPLQKGEKALFPVAINREGLIEPCSNCYHPNGECIDFLNKGECKLYKEIVSLWDSTIPKKDRDLYGWDANPWVWLVEFERIEVEE